MSARARQDNQPGYVLHTYAFRETSLVVETFTRSHGRVAMVARGAKRPRSALRGSIMAFQPLGLSWSGRGELRLLIRAEWQGGQPRLQGRALLCGFYLNELLLKLLPREDAHEQLFLDYQAALARLAEEPEPGAVLRRFERALLRELGYALTLERDSVLHATQRYTAGGSTRASSPPTPAGGTVRTGHGAVRMTRSATLPITTRPTPVRPWVPSTMRWMPWLLA